MGADSGLIVPFLDLEPVVGRHRLRHDPSAARGVPAHVTLHFPWIPAAAVDADALDRVRELAATVRPFPVTFAELRWFDADVLWLAPTPDRELRRLSDDSAARWPEAPRYGGEFDDLAPHLTIGDRTGAGGESGLRESERELAAALPLHTTATEIWWIRLGADGRWTRAATFPLGG